MRGRGREGNQPHVVSVGREVDSVNESVRKEGREEESKGGRERGRKEGEVRRGRSEGRREGGGNGAFCISIETCHAPPHFPIPRGYYLLLSQAEGKSPDPHQL